MPKIDIQTSNEKKLDLSEFYDGEEAYIYIKKIDRATRKKIYYYRSDGVLVNVSKRLTELLESGEANGDEKISFTDAVNTIEPDKKDRCIESDAKVEELYLLNGVNQEKHNFTDMFGDPLLLDVIFWANAPMKMLVKVLKEIEHFNGDEFTLKKKKKMK